MLLSLTTTLKRCSKLLWCLVAIQIAAVVVYMTVNGRLTMDTHNGGRYLIVPGKDPERETTTHSTYSNQSYQIESSPLSQKGTIHRGTPRTRTTIAIGMGITTIHIKDYRRTQSLYNLLPFLNTFLVSFCRTASSGYTYNFYLAYDFNDKLLSDGLFKRELAHQFSRYIHRSHTCDQSSVYSLTYVECSHSGNPAWAQNDAMMHAYLAGNQYFYRVNDDTILLTPGWTEAYIDTLAHFDPPNVGVVGPNHHGGNIRILTYDFVHRTHIELFGYYYPREFKTWYADGWITNIYKPGRMVKLDSVHVEHTQEMGRRYSVSEPMAQSSKIKIITSGKDAIIRYVSVVENNMKTKRKARLDRVISLSLWNNSDDILWGLVRNAQLQRVFFPTWTLRVYCAVPTNSTAAPSRIKIAKSFNRNDVLETLKGLGVDIRFVGRQSFPELVPMALWHFAVADDPEVSEFLIRDPRQRFSWRETSAVSVWLSTSNMNHSVVHCQRDHPSHGQWPLVNSLWGAKQAKLALAMSNQSMISALSKYANMKAKSNMTASTLANSFLRDVVWPHVNSSVLCHDSVSCDQWPGGRNYNKKRPKWDYIGNFYNSHEVRMSNFKKWQIEKYC